MKLDQIIETYQNTTDRNFELFNEFESIAKNDEIIWNHRMYIEEYKLGWGDRAFHGMWKTIIESLQSNFRFLEIGVYKGQVLSLVSLLSKCLSKDGLIFGITPLDAIGDKYWKAPESDYLKDIRDLFEKFELDFSMVNLHKGLSTDFRSIEFAKDQGPFDVVYVDGGHDFSIVKSDIINFKELVKINGYLIMDDASCFLNIPYEINNGLIDVSEATRDFIETDDRFINIFNCGHNRIFKRIK